MGAGSGTGSAGGGPSAPAGSGTGAARGDPSAPAGVGAGFSGAAPSAPSLPGWRAGTPGLRRGMRLRGPPGKGRPAFQQASSSTGTSGMRTLAWQFRHKVQAQCWFAPVRTSLWQHVADGRSTGFRNLPLPAATALGRSSSSSAAATAHSTRKSRRRQRLATGAIRGVGKAGAGAGAGAQAKQAQPGLTAAEAPCKPAPLAAGVWFLKSRLSLQKLGGKLCKCRAASNSNSCKPSCQAA